MTTRRDLVLHGLLAATVAAFACASPRQAIDESAPPEFADLCEQPLVDTSPWAIVPAGRYRIAVPPGFTAAAITPRTATGTYTFSGSAGTITVREGFSLAPSLANAALSRQCSTTASGKLADVYVAPNRTAYALYWGGVGLDGRDVLVSVVLAPGTRPDSAALFAVPWTLEFARR